MLKTLGLQVQITMKRKKNFKKLYRKGRISSLSMEIFVFLPPISDKYDKESFVAIW